MLSISVAGRAAAKCSTEMQFREFAEEKMVAGAGFEPATFGL
jgi:hypothetical protein